MIITVKEQRALEMRAVENGISLVRLMQNAGESVFSLIRERYDIANLSVCVLCGNGGNGGDGFVTARLLKQAGANPVIVLCSGEPESDAALAMFRQAVSEGALVLDVRVEREKIVETIYDCYLIIDAVYGTGFHGELNESFKELFIAVNQSRAAVISVDVPSGVDADTGEADENAVRAELTVSFIASKPANVFKSARRNYGETVVADIGVPKECFLNTKSELTEIDAKTVLKMLSPRNESGHKGDFGRLLVTAGSDRYRGAAVLAVLGAYNTGAGLVSLASGEKTLCAVASRVPEAIFLDPFCAQQEYIAELKRCDACLIGCGLTVTAQAQELFVRTLKSAECQLVIDADGLNILASEPSLFRLLNDKTILTPHVGEFSRLTGIAAQDILKDRVGYAREYAEKHGVTLVLKSDNTVVAPVGGPAFINTIGNSGLAKAGSGDLLSGVIAALLAMGKRPADAAAAGVYLHSLAADIAAEIVNKHSLTASRIAGYIDAAYTSLFTKNNTIKAEVTV